MSDSQNVRIPKRRRWWWMAPIIIVLLILLGALLWLGLAGRGFDKAIAEARQLGGPVLLHEVIAARRGWGNDENGALVIQGLFSQLDDIPCEEAVDDLPWIGEAEMPPLGQRWPEKMRRAVQVQLDLVSEQLATIDTLSNFPGGRFDWALRPNPLETLLPHLSRLRLLARLKAIQAIDRANRGDLSHAVKDVDILFRLSSLLADEPGGVSQLVRIACEVTAVETVERMCALGELTPDQTRLLAERLRVVEKRSTLDVALRGERAMWIGAVRWMTTQGPDGGGFPLLRPLARVRVRRMGAGLVRLLNASIEVCDDPRRALEVVRQFEEGALADGRAGAGEALALMLLPTHEIEGELTRLASLRSARTALAIERYRLDNAGRLPDALADLVPTHMDQVALDPFDGLGLRYQADSGAAVIYSVGTNLVAEGGDVSPHPAGNPHGPDVSFTVLPPSHRGVATKP